MQKQTRTPNQHPKSRVAVSGLIRRSSGRLVAWLGAPLRGQDPEEGSVVWPPPVDATEIAPSQHLDHPTYLRRGLTIAELGVGGPTERRMSSSSAYGWVGPLPGRSIH